MKGRRNEPVKKNERRKRVQRRGGESAEGNSINPKGRNWACGASSHDISWK